jgi:hypothetical protein
MLEGFLMVIIICLMFSRYYSVAHCILIQENLLMLRDDSTITWFYA